MIKNKFWNELAQTVSKPLEIWVLSVLIIYALLVMNWWHFIWFFFCLLYSLYMIVGVFPLTVLMFGCIFVYLGLCNIIFYFDYLIFSFLGCIFKGILKFISYNWNKISQFHIFVFCSILLDYCVKKSLCQKNIFNNI